jgi:parallel beta-helix repeat protein
VFTWSPKPSCTHSTIRGNRFHHNFGDDIDIREGAHDIVVEDNLCEYSAIGHIALHSDAHDNIVRHNICRYGGYYTETMRWPGSSSINFHEAGPGNVADGNFSAYQIDSTGNDGNGFIVDLMYDNPVTIINNVAYRNMGSGVTTTETWSCVVVNNTFVENGYRRSNMRNGSGMRFARAADTNHTIVNNIFQSNAVAGIKSYRLIDRQALIDNNLYYCAPGVPYIWDGYNLDERRYYTLQDVRDNTRWGDNSVDGDPKFAAEGDLNFRILDGSPAIGAALPAQAPGHDYDGTDRDSAPDIGAFEHVTTKGVARSKAGVIRDGTGHRVPSVYDLKGRRMWSGAWVRTPPASPGVYVEVRMHANRSRATAVRPARFHLHARWE